MNPYQSPKIPPPREQTNDRPDGAIQLLTEIRDNQQEMLRIYRRSAAISRFSVLTAAAVGVLAVAIMVVVGVVKILMLKG